MAKVEITYPGTVITDEFTALVAQPTVPATARPVDVGLVQVSTPTELIPGPPGPMGPPGPGVTSFDTPPASPVDGDLWWESDTGTLWTWYVDADSSQWVQISGGTGSETSVTVITPQMFGAKADGVTDDAAACNAAAAYMVANGGRLYCPKGTYLLGSMWLFTITSHDLEVICEAGARFVAKAGFPGGDKKLVCLAQAVGLNVKWTGGFFDGRNMPNSLPGEANDVFSCPLNNAASLTLSDMIIEAGDYWTTAGSDTCLGAASAKRMSLTRIRCKGAPDCGIYLSGGSVGDGLDERILEELTFNEISIDNCLAAFNVKRRFRRVSGGSCFFTDCGTGLTLGAEASMQNGTTIVQADEMHVESIVARRCGYALCFRFARNATAGSLIHKEMGCKITAGSGFETAGAYGLVLQGAQRCIVDSVIVDGGNAAIAGLITNAVRVGSATINSEFRGSTDNTVKAITGDAVTSLVLELDGSQMRNTYGSLKGTFSEGVKFSPSSQVEDAFTLANAIGSSGMASGLTLCLDAADGGSYAGGTSWVDRTVGRYDFFLGTDATATSTDPVFHGLANGRSSAEYFTCDGTQYFTYDSPSEAWMDAFHKDNATFTVAAYVYASDITAWSLCGNTGASGTAAGFSVNVSTGSLLQVLVQNGTGIAMSVPSVALVPSNVWSFLAVSVNEATGANGVILRLNDTTAFGTSTYTTPSAAAAANVMQIGARGVANNIIGAGNRIGCIAMWNRALSFTEIEALHAVTRRRYAV